MKDETKDGLNISEENTSVEETVVDTNEIAVDKKEDEQPKAVSEKNEKGNVELNEHKSPKFFSKHIGSIGPLVGALIILVFIGLITFLNVKDQVDDNSLKIQQEIAESIHYIDLYEATGDERYVLHLYGELRSLDTLITQTTNLSLAYPSLFFTPSKSDLSHVVKAHIQNLELSIDYKKNLDPREILFLRQQLKLVSNEASPNDSFKSFIKESNRLLR